MKNPLKKFRADLSCIVLDFLWSAWSQVGVMGGGASSRPIIVDPEPMLLLTLECARQDARVFDEILDWLVINGRWINVGRLTTLLEEDQTCAPSIIGAVAEFMSQRDKTPKWKNLARICRPNSPVKHQPLFRQGGISELNWPRGEIFWDYGWRRAAVRLRGQSQPFPPSSTASLIFKCRAFFGMTIRADAFAYLMTRGPATASRMARELGYSQRRVQETMIEMELAGQFQTRMDANRKEYSIEPAKGWQLLYPAKAEPARCFRWRAYARGMAIVWKAAFAMREEGLTDYIFESELAKAIEEARQSFSAAGFHLPDRPAPAEFLKIIADFE